MARIFGDRFHLDLAALFLVDKNIKTACYVYKNVREYRRGNQKGTIQSKYMYNHERTRLDISEARGVH